MLLRRTSGAVATLFSGSAVKFCDRLYSRVANSSGKPFSKIPRTQRLKAVEELQKALAEYLHTTRSLPFVYANSIARNSPQSLWQAVSKIPFSRSTYANSFQRFLRYHPINEIDFFFESIGLACGETSFPPAVMPPDTLFLSDWKHFDVFCAVAAMGFPWGKMGLLCKDSALLCDFSSIVLQVNINEIRDTYGFDAVTVISICLAFPSVLFYGKMETAGLLSDLKTLFLDHGLLNAVNSDVEAILEVCEKIKVFYYSLGCEMGEIGELMGRSKSIFLDHSKEVVVSKISYFSKLCVEKDQIGLLLLTRPEIFGFDIENRTISISGFLEQFGCTREELQHLKQKYPYVFGRNRIANLPSILRSMDLHVLFFEKMKSGDLSFFQTYTIDSTEDVDETYMCKMSEISAIRTQSRELKKLNFLHSIGFGENRRILKALSALRSSGSQLQQRFDCLLEFGIEYSKLCAIVNRRAMILNQPKGPLLKKLLFLCTDMGLSLDCLDDFPDYLCYSLEKRIKPRWKMHKWLIDRGVSEVQYSLATIVATSEKNFFARISCIDPSLVRRYNECFRTSSEGAAV